MGSRHGDEKLGAFQTDRIVASFDERFRLPRVLQMPRGHDMQIQFGGSSQTRATAVRETDWTGPRFVSIASVEVWHSLVTSANGGYLRRA
jgi:hypothetical protein